MWLSFLSILICLLVASYPRWRRETIIKRWYKSFHLEKHSNTYNQIFTNIDGFKLSRQARAQNDAMEYTYGEIDFISFIALLSLVKPDQNTVFFDLGSGIGTAVIACALVFPIKKSCGIELFKELHNAALISQQHLQNYTDAASIVPKLHFIHNNFLHVDFSDATLIFINATALFGETWLALNQHLAHIAPQATVITTSKKLSSTAFTLTKITTVQMSWGSVKAYIHYPYKLPNKNNSQNLL